MQQARDRKISPDKKYAVWKPAKKKTMVGLLLKDDEKKFLSEQQRTDLLTVVGKQYLSAKKKAMKENRQKLTIAQANEQNMNMEEIIQGIKEKWITLD